MFVRAYSHSARMIVALACELNRQRVGISAADMIAPRFTRVAARMPQLRVPG